MGNCCSSDEKKRINPQQETPTNNKSSAEIDIENNGRGPQQQQLLIQQQPQQQEEVPNIENAELIFKGVQTIAQAELDQELSQTLAKTLAEAAKMAGVAEVGGWQKNATKAGFFISKLLSAAAKHTPPPFSLAVSAIAKVVQVVATNSTNKTMAKELSDRLVSLHPLMFDLAKSKCNENEYLSFRLLECIRKCKTLLDRFADLGEETGTMETLKQKYGQFTTWPTHFDERHAELDRFLLDVTSSTNHQILVEMRQRPTLEDLRRTLLDDIDELVVTKVIKHLDFKFEENGQKIDRLELVIRDGNAKIIESFLRNRADELLHDRFDRLERSMLSCRNMLSCGGIVGAFSVQIKVDDEPEKLCDVLSIASASAFISSTLIDGLLPDKKISRITIALTATSSGEQQEQGQQIPAAEADMNNMKVNNIIESAIDLLLPQSIDADGSTRMLAAMYQALGYTSESFVRALSAVNNNVYADSTITKNHTGLIRRWAEKRSGGNAMNNHISSFIGSLTAVQRQRPDVKKFIEVFFPAKKN